jgi:N utilization substance protein B
MALYAYELNGDPREVIMKMILNPRVEQDIPKEDTDDREFAKKLFLSTIDHCEEADAIVKDQLKNWDMERLALIDKIVLRMALTEIVSFSDIPVKVSINEAIEIAKNFSTANSGKFVNGILDSACQLLQQDGRIRKSGRGLIEHTPKK